MRFALASAFSAAVVLSSPFMGQLQSLLRSAVSTRVYVLLLGGLVFGAILLAIVVAFRRSRTHRAARVAAMAAACALGAAYTSALSTGAPEIDAVERVHFIEYGAIAVLFYRVWRRAGDPSTIVLPMLWGFAAGTLDEWLQWFIPYRVGEAHDVFLNLTALACGVLFGMALEPPPVFRLRPRTDSLSRMGVTAAGAVLVFAGFIDSVHMGHDVHVDGIGRFTSRYAGAELDVLQADRSGRWATQPPIGIRRLSREDQYLDEALWHVRERNRLWNAHDVTGAWHENLILERYFAPVLDRPTYVSPTGTRWPAEHRADAAARATPTPAFVSAAAPQTIVTWNRTAYWLLVTLIAAPLAATGLLVPRGRRWRG